MASKTQQTRNIRAKKQASQGTGSDGQWKGHERRCWRRVKKGRPENAHERKTGSITTEGFGRGLGRGLGGELS